jgi:hypothetical protein
MHHQIKGVAGRVKPGHDDGDRSESRIAGLTWVLLGAALAVLLASGAQAQTSKFDGLRGCERIGAVQFKRHNPAFRRFRIERAGVAVDRYAAMVGNQYVATIYSGKASYDGGSGAKPVRFVCLHGGIGRGPLLVYTLAD